MPINIREMALLIDFPLFLIPEPKPLSSFLQKETEVLFLFESEQDANFTNHQNKRVLDSMLEAVARQQTQKPPLNKLNQEQLILDSKMYFLWDTLNTNLRYIFIFGEKAAYNAGLSVEPYTWQNRQGVQILQAHRLQEIETQKEFKKAIWQILIQEFF